MTLMAKYYNNTVVAINEITVSMKTIISSVCYAVIIRYGRGNAAFTYLG